MRSVGERRTKRAATLRDTTGDVATRLRHASSQYRGNIRAPATFARAESRGNNYARDRSGCQTIRAARTAVSTFVLSSSESPLLSLSLSLSHSFSLFSLLFPVCRHCVKHAQRGILYINFSDDGLHTCRAYARARALRERGDASGEGGGGGGGGGLVKAALDFSIEGTRGCTRDFSPRVLVS